MALKITVKGGDLWICHQRQALKMLKKKQTSARRAYHHSGRYK
jgi:hypothetical protein